MALQILTPMRHVWSEVVNFTAAAPADHREAGVFVALDSAGAEPWRTFKAAAGAAASADAVALLETNSHRPDTGFGVVSGNPSYAFIGDAGTAVVIRDWRGLLIVTDKIDITGLAFGDDLAIVDGELIAAGANPVLGKFLGAASADYKVEGGYVVQLIK